MNHKVRNVLRFLRIAFALAMLAGTVLLVHWNRSQDPRFWAFLETPPGRVLVSILQWRGKVPDPSPNVRLSAEEERIRAQWEKKIASGWPTARLTLQNGKTRVGHVIAEDGRSVTFEEAWSRAGRVSVRILLSEIGNLTAYPAPPPGVSPRDVKFLLEKPGLNLHRFPPFTIVTDEPFSEVVGYVRELERLDEQIRTAFAGLITRTNRVDGIQVLVFSNEDDYKGFQKRHAPNLENTAGFYAVMLDRLVLYNQAGSSAAQELRDSVASTADSFRNGAGRANPEYDRMIRRQQQAMLRNIDRQSRMISTQVLRHEGAHQLFHALGIHSSFHAENTWLMEGLAVYCEADRPGAVIRANVQAVQDAVKGGRNIALADLVNHRSARGLLDFEDTRSQGGALAYAQSWALVHYLLQGSTRPRFENFIRFLRDRKNLKEVAVTPQMDLLLRFLEVDAAALEQNLRRHLATL